MKRRGAYGHALRRVRQHRQMPQDGMSSVISRAYVSELERGRKHPTVTKVDELCEALDAHPLTTYILAFADRPGEVDKILRPAVKLAKEILRAQEKAQ